jgi:hypothetical protein
MSDCQDDLIVSSPFQQSGDVGGIYGAYHGIIKQNITSQVSPVAGGTVDIYHVLPTSKGCLVAGNGNSPWFNLTGFIELGTTHEVQHYGGGENQANQYSKGNPNPF